jgi:glycosyltransferase involved in cell wall biosynthesis
MKISVAIPTYNRGHLICQTIDSILNQTIKVDEIVIVDDGSSDNTQQTVAKYGDKIRYEKAANAGPAAARASAINLCSGEWIALCDSDDIWQPKHIENFIVFNQLFSTANVCFMNFGILDDDVVDNIGTDKFSEAPGGWWDNVTLNLSDNKQWALLHQDAYNDFLRFQPIFPTALFFKRSLYDEIGGITSKVSRMNSEDAHLTRRLLAYGTTGCCKEISVQIRKHDGNFSKDNLENLKGRKMILEYLVRDNDIPQRFILPTEKEIERSNLMIFRNLYWAGRNSEAIKAFNDVDRNLITVRDKIRYLKSKVLKFSN